MFSIYNNGKPSPMGYSQTLENGLKISNFALFSSAADAIELCLFRDGEESRFAMSRTNDIWHVAIEGVEMNDEYAFRITGKNDRTLANPQKLMLDPYAKAVTHKPDLSSPEARSIFLLMMNEIMQRLHLKVALWMSILIGQGIVNRLFLGLKPLCMN